MGHPVTHFDKILLEQEWYFLGSCAPYESSMYKHSNFEIALDRKNVSSGSKLFNPREDCTWKFVLVSLPTDKNEEERIREYMMQDAAVQIVQSGEGRWKTRERLNVNIVNSLPEHLKVKHVAETELAHKQTPEDAQQAMVNKYDQIAMSNFGSDAHNLKLLEALYGAESVVFQNALRACQIRKEQLEAIGGTVKKELKKQYKKERSDLEKSRIEFWDNCNKLLVSSEAYANMPSFMEKYYNSDHIKKFKAGMLILKFINKRRNRLKTKFSYAVEMRNVDKIAKQKIIEQEKHDRLFQIEQERILELAANKAVRLAEAAAANTTASSAVSTSRVTRNRGAKINIGKGRNTSIVTQIPQRLNSLRKSSSSFIKIKGLPDSNKNEHIRRHLSTDPPNSTNLGTFVTKVKPAMGGENAIEAVGKEDFDSRPCSPHEANVLRAQMEVMAKFNYVDQIQMDDDNNAGSPYHSRGNSPSNSSIRPSYSTNSLMVDTQGNSLNQRMPPRPSTASVIDKGRIGASMPAIREDATSVSRPNSPHPQSPHSAPHIVLGHNRLLNSPNIKHARKYVLSQDGHEGHEEVMYKSSSPVPASPARNPFTPKYAETSPIRKVESNSNSKPNHEVSNSTPARPHTAGGATKARPHSKSRPGSANKAVSSGTSSCGHWSRRPCSANIYAPPPSYEKDTPCEANDARAHLRRSVEHANEHKFNAAMNTRNLAQTPSRTYGLPRDVMRHQQKNSVSLDTSIKFLQAASKNPNLFEDVSAKQKRFQ